jgi:hypothetical protein
VTLAAFVVDKMSCSGRGWLMSEAVGRQSVRQAARRVAFEARAKLRAERQERDKRLAALALEVLVALGERDGAVRLFEQRASQALHRMLEQEQLSVTDVIQWCGPQMTRRDVARLRRFGAQDPSTVAAGDRPESVARPAQRQPGVRGSDVNG